MQKITSCLWFDSQAEEAAKFYSTIFKNTKLGSPVRYDESSAKAAGRPVGSVLTIEFEIEGYKFLGLNGGPAFNFTPAISFFINCKTADEVEKLWDKLSKDGIVLMPLDKYPFSEKYGWVQDKYGLSWQLILRQESSSQKIVPSLLFVNKVYGKAEEAINFYTSVFHNSKAGTFSRYEAGMEPDKEGTIAYADFSLEGEQFAAMDSAHQHKFNFNEAISFMVNCKDQKELDYYWEKLSAVPESEMCGWLKDKYGISWQIIPATLGKLLSDPKKSKRVMEKVLTMKKLDIAELENA